MKRGPSLFPTPQPGQFWPVIKWHVITVYLSCWVYAVIKALDWLTG